MIPSHKRPRPHWEEAIGNAGPTRQEGSSPGDARGGASGPWCKSHSAPAASVDPQENQATQGAWPFTPHSPRHLKEALFIGVAFLGTDNIEARSCFEVEL